ncbi:MAG: hypothetical protein AAF787_09485 [Chloroflexota bacterium]
MHRWLWISWGLVLLVAACQPSPATVVYVVVTSTPEVTSSAIPTQSDTLAPQQPTATRVAPTAIIPTAVPGPSATADLFPTETVAQVQVAEQVFENGRMFWVQPVSQIWVMVIDEEGRGTWLRYEDTFVEGDPETDPSITAPEGLIQPERGFGKLWRDNPEIRDSLGWAVTPEFGYISEYEYTPGGTIRNGRFVTGPGSHRLMSLNSEAFCFEEDTSTWQLGC